MYTALLYKEWIKLRWLFFLLIAISSLAFLKIFLNISTAIKIKGAYHLWSVVIFHGSVFYNKIEYLLPFAGILTALVQFIPETRQRRLRLLFHLPISHNKSLFFMIFTGFAMISTIIIFNYILLVLLISPYFPSEIVFSAIISSSPWFLSGLVAYLGVSLAVVEPAMWRKIIYGFAAFAMIMLFFNGKKPMVYEYSLYKYILLSSFYLVTLLLPAFRFKKGLD